MTEANTEAEPEARDFEAEAKNLGWHNPEDEDYRGDKETALSAEDFVKKGENELPVLKENLRKMQKKLDANDADKEEFKAYMNNQLESSRKAHEDLKRQAVKDGDIEKYNELNKNPPKEVQAKGDVAVSEASEIETTFAQRNEWYGKDERRTKAAMNVDASLANLRGVLSTEEFCERIEQEVERLMPTKAQHNSVTPSRKKLGSSSSKSKGFDGMPKEFQDTCKRLEQKWGIERDGYVKTYYEGLENE